VLEQPRSTQRRQRLVPEEQEQLVSRMVELATQYGRYGYRRITALLRAAGWPVNHKRIERLWRQEGLKVPQQQPKRRRLWLNDGSCVRLRPAYRDHVWSYDFIHARTHEGRVFRLLTIIDEYSRESLAIKVARGLTSEDVSACICHSKQGGSRQEGKKARQSADIGRLQLTSQEGPDG